MNKRINKLEDQINERYNKLSEKEKEKHLKSFKVTYVSILIVCILALLFFIGMTVFSLLEVEISAIILPICGIGIFIGMLIWVIKRFYWTQELKIKNQIVCDIKKEQEIKDLEERQKRQQEAIQAKIDKILKVTLLDTYTEYSDKLHAILNYQEIIQTRYYKFRVDYKDGNSQIITTKENSPDYYFYIKLVGKEEAINKNVSNADEIKKYKQLLDEGIITQEEFERKKKELL